MNGNSLNKAIPRESVEVHLNIVLSLCSPISIEYLRFPITSVIKKGIDLEISEWIKTSFWRSRM